MTHIKNTFTKALVSSFTMALLLSSSACSLMHDDYADCRQELRVNFVYDMNMKFADAFKGQVKNVTLHAYDADGNLALEKTESSDAILARGGYMTLDVKPGNYRLEVWAEGEQRQADSYVYGKPSANASTISALDCRINRSSRYLDHDLTALYHGLTDADLSLNGYGVKTATVRLTKDTNNVRVVIQNASGKRLNADDFSFFIDDDNSWLAFDNSPLKEDSITYTPWSQYDGTAGGTEENVAMKDAEKATTQMSAVVAEMTVNRLFTSKQPRLRVRNNTNGKTVFSIPLIDYALLVKGNYNRSMSNQEYLDRQDEYNFIFFVDDNLNWLSASIVVNSWRIVLQNTNM